MSLAELHARSTDAALAALGICHVALEVADVARAKAFYVDCLGLDEEVGVPWPDRGATVLACSSGQRVVLVPSDSPRTFPDSGVHVAYRAAPGALARIIEEVSADGVEVHRYREDRPAEEMDNVYLADPDGNRIQLVAGDGAGGGVSGIDHSAVQVSDIEWAEAFYAEALGLPVVHRVGWKTADYVRAQAWAEGREDMAPGTRRWDRRYRAIPGRPDRSRRVARANMQVFLGVGPAVLGIYLALTLAQEPPPGRAVGTPRTAYAVDRPMLKRWAAALASAGVAVEGPIEHPVGAPAAASLHFRDPCGNFIELAVPRAQGQWS